MPDPIQYPITTSDYAETIRGWLPSGDVVGTTDAQSVSNKTDAGGNTYDMALSTLNGADGERVQYVKDWAGLMAIPSTAVAVGDTVFRMDTQSIYTRSATASDVQQSGGSSMHFDVEPYPWGVVLVSQFGLTGQSDDDDTVGRFISFLNANADIQGVLPSGTTSFSTTKTITRNALSLIGLNDPGRRRGSAAVGPVLKWVGSHGTLTGDTATITAITQADPCVVTAVGHGYSSFDAVEFSGIGGMTELNGKSYVITVLDADTFAINEIDSTDFTAYTSGGTAAGITLHPMFSTTTSNHTFAGFAIDSDGSTWDDNTGKAAYFLEVDTSQSITMRDIYIQPSSFSHSVIKTNGNGVGYSRFERIFATNPAPKFLHIDDQGTSNGVTFFKFTDCEWAGSTSAAFGEWTVLFTNGEKLENVTFEGGVVNANGKVILLDNRVNAPSEACLGVCVRDVEFDSGIAGTDPNYCYLQLKNTLNISVTNNNFAGYSAHVGCINLINSTVVAHHGNHLSTVQYLFLADDDSRVRGSGMNNVEWSSVQGICNNLLATYTTLPFAAGNINIDGREWGPNEVGMYVMDISTADAHTLILDTTKPENFEEGQRFTIVLRNTSGGAVATTAVSAAIRLNSAITAPASGRQTAIDFIFQNGKARQLGAQGPDVRYD